MERDSLSEPNQSGTRLIISVISREVMPMVGGRTDRRGERFDPRSFANDPDIARLLQEIGVGIVSKNGGLVPSKAATS